MAQQLSNKQVCFSEASMHEKKKTPLQNINKLLTVYDSAF